MLNVSCQIAKEIDKNARRKKKLFNVTSNPSNLHTVRSYKTLLLCNIYKIYI